MLGSNGGLNVRSIYGSPRYNSAYEMKYGKKLQEICDEFGFNLNRQTSLMSILDEHVEDFIDNWWRKGFIIKSSVDFTVTYPEDGDFIAVIEIEKFSLAANYRKKHLEFKRKCCESVGIPFFIRGKGEGGTNFKALFELFRKYRDARNGKPIIV